MPNRDAYLQRTKRFFFDQVVPLSLWTWLQWGSSIALLIAWILLLEVVRNRQISLIDVTGDLKIDVAFDAFKVAKVTDTIRFGVWGICNGEATLSTLIHTWHIDPACKPHPVNFHFSSELNEILDLDEVDKLGKTIEGLASAFVKLHPFGVAMGIIGWILSMSRRRIIKWRTRTILHLPHPDWAVIPSAIGAIMTVILSICFVVLEFAPLKARVFGMNIKLFSASATLDLEGGNARNYDVAAAIFFVMATSFYLVGFFRRWSRRRGRLEQDHIIPESVPITQLEETLPFRLGQRLSQRLVQRFGRREDKSEQPSHELPVASGSAPLRANTEDYRAPEHLVPTATTFQPVYYADDRKVESLIDEKQHVPYYYSSQVMINGRFMSSPEAMTSPHKTLEELNLLKCSLLPGELLEFIADSSQWNVLLETYALDPDCELPDLAECPAPHFQLKLEASSDVYYDVVLPPVYAAAANTLPVVSVKGDNLGRTEQERWQRVVADALANVHGSEYPLFELISSHLLPCLHEALDNTDDPQSTPDPSASAPEPDEARRRLSSPHYHALFVSHHLKSPQKRRSLSQWSHELSLSGFAKVGYPGVIYCEGTREDVEDFVDRVKSMQWLALRLRFIEPAPSVGPEEHCEEGQRGRWTEFEKVGEVVEEMRRLKRENFVVEMGIGSAGNPPAK